MSLIKWGIIGTAEGTEGKGNKSNLPFYKYMTNIEKLWNESDI